MSNDTARQKAQLKALRLAMRGRMHVGAEAEITPDTKITGLAETWFAEISAQDRSPGDRHLRAVRDKHGASLAKL